VYGLFDSFGKVSQRPGRWKGVYSGHAGLLYKGYKLAAKPTDMRLHFINPQPSVSVTLILSMATFILKRLYAPPGRRDAPDRETVLCCRSQFDFWNQLDFSKEAYIQHKILFDFSEILY
jgi:hypothetical protein